MDVEDVLALSLHQCQIISLIPLSITSFLSFLVPFCVFRLVHDYPLYLYVFILIHNNNSKRRRRRNSNEISRLKIKMYAFKIVFLNFIIFFSFVFFFCTLNDLFNFRIYVFHIFFFISFASFIVCVFSGLWLPCGAGIDGKCGTVGEVLMKTSKISREFFTFYWSKVRILSKFLTNFLWD